MSQEQPQKVSQEQEQPPRLDAQKPDPQLTTKMSQEQPQKVSQEQEQPQRLEAEKPIKYGDVFLVAGELASKPIAPQDAAMMQTAESAVLGKTQKGGPAAAMQAAATHNERAGLVTHAHLTDITGNKGVTVTETDVPGSRLITESVAGQVVGQYYQPTPVPQTTPVSALQQSAITIGEALEATAMTAGDKPVDQSDAAAIQAAEVRATGCNVITPGGLAALAQSAAAFNATTNRDEDKIKLNHVLKDATSKLPADKAATVEDAEGVMNAAIRNNPDLGTHSGGVAASIAAAARLNQNNTVI